MNYRGSTSFLVLLGLLLSTASVSAQCPPGTTIGGGDDALRSFLIEIFTSETPRKATPAEQEQAPSTAGDTGTLVDSPSLPRLLALAFENNLLETAENGVFTIHWNPFLFKTLRDPNVLRSDAYHELKNARVRRWGSTFAFGGEGERFDRDGDGVTDDPVKADQLTDIVTWEVSYRLHGSRDRRDPRNWKTVQCELTGRVAPQAEISSCVEGNESTDQLEQVAKAWDALINQIQQNLQDFRDPFFSQCLSKAKIRTFVGSSDTLPAAFKSLNKSLAALEKARDQLFEKVDRRPILTLAYGGTERKGENLGPDKRYAALRGALGGWEGNLQWTQTEAMGGLPDPEVWKLGIKRTWLVLQGSEFSTNGLEVALAGSYETFDNVPDAMHDTNSKLSVSTEIPISEMLKLPISVTWANHQDLLTDEDEIRGHVGLSVDFESLFKKKQ